MKQQFKKEFDETFTPKNEKSFWGVFFAAFLISWGIVLSAATFSSCNTTKRAARKVENAKTTLSQNPKESAKYCAEKHPVKESTKIEYKYKTGKSVYLHDTSFVTVDCDSVVKANGAHMGIIKKGTVKRRTPSIVKIPVPTYLQVDTAAIESVIERENVAMQAVLNNRIDSLHTLLIKNGEILASKDKKIETIKTQRNCGWAGCGILLFAGFLLIIGLVKGWFR